MASDAKTYTAICLTLILPESVSVRPFAFELSKNLKANKIEAALDGIGIQVQACRDAKAPHLLSLAIAGKAEVSPSLELVKEALLSCFE